MKSKTESDIVTNQHKEKVVESSASSVTNSTEQSTLNARASEPPVAPDYVHKVYTSDSEEHYKNLITYFKDIVWATTTILGIVTVILAAIGGVSLWFSYKSISDVKTEVKQSLDTVKTDTKAAIDNTTNGAKTAIDDTKSEAREAIGQTKSATETQISQIRGQAAAIALNEAQRRVDAAFAGDNVQLMVERAAKSQVAPVIERQLRGEVDRAMDSIQGDMAWLGQILDAGAYMRNGGRDGLEKLIAIQKNAPNETVRQRAQSTFNVIASDYEKVFRNRLKESGFNKALQVFYEPQKNESQASIVARLVEVVRTDRDLENVTNAFLSLREVTGQSFRMFDLEAVEHWCSEHTAQCKK